VIELVILWLADGPAFRGAKDMKIITAACETHGWNMVVDSALEGYFRVTPHHFFAHAAYGDIDGCLPKEYLCIIGAKGTTTSAILLYQAHDDQGGDGRFGQLEQALTSQSTSMGNAPSLLLLAFTTLRSSELAMDAHKVAEVMEQRLVAHAVPAQARHTLLVSSAGATPKLHARR
jgi:hypothetical protein